MLIPVTNSMSVSDVELLFSSSLPQLINIRRAKIIVIFFIRILVFQMLGNVYVYELWRVSARTSLNKNWLWKIRRIFQVRTDQAIAYILCCGAFFYSTQAINPCLIDRKSTRLNSSH